MRGKNLIGLCLTLLLVSSFLFVNLIYSKEISQCNDIVFSNPADGAEIIIPNIETWKLKYIISDKVLDAVVVLARENRKIPSSYNNTDDCAREYVRQNLVFATWGKDCDGNIWIQSYRLGNGLVQIIWGPDSPHEELIGKKYLPEQILTESDGSKQHYFFGDT